jgi:hypothetical protein
MTLATIKKVNAAIEKFGVEIVKGNGYFYFADIGDAYVSDNIESVYSCHLRCMTVEQWLSYVESAIQS